MALVEVVARLDRGIGGAQSLRELRLALEADSQRARLERAEGEHLATHLEHRRLLAERELLRRRPRAPGTTVAARPRSSPQPILAGGRDPLGVDHGHPASPQPEPTQAVWYLRCENWNETFPTPPRSDADDRAAAARGGRRRQGGPLDRRRGRARGRAGRARRPRRCSRGLPAGRGGPAVRSRRRDRRSLRDDRARGAAASLRRPRERRHHPRRPGAGARAGRRGLLPPSAADDPRRRRRPDRRAVRGLGLERGGPAPRRAARRAPRDAPLRGARGTARRLPRRRLDRLQPAGRARGVGRRAARRIGIEDARELLAPLVLRTAANWAERGPEALTGPIARGDAATVERHLAALRDDRPRAAAAVRGARRAGQRAGARATEAPA